MYDRILPDVTGKTAEELVAMYQDYTGRFNRAAAWGAVETGAWAAIMRHLWAELRHRGVIDENGRGL